jgi:response regulator RpfG family c-di-GMP phosphodiesterase
MTGTRVLLVDDEVVRRDERLFELESQYGYAVTGCGTVREARDLLATREVHLVLSSATLGSSDAVALMRRINRDTANAPAVVILAQPQEHGLRRLAWSEGADAVLTEPVDASELAAALKSVVEARSRRLAAVAAQKELAASLDHLADVLVLVLDAAVPGSASRGADLARLVTSLGAKFAMEVTLFDDLQRAARLHEVGRFTLGDAGMREPGVSPAGRCTMASASLLIQVPMLEGVADIIDKIGANWDGSGLPAGVQRGQIPMRSRLLRVGVDLLAGVERSALKGDSSLASAARELQAHTGIWYDPAVVAALNTMLAEEHPPQWHEDVAMVTFDRLAVGMRLAADLETASGVKLLSDGAVLTATTLQLIRRRHEIDPLLLPVPIHQRTS